MVIASCVIGRFRDDQAVTCCLVVVGRGRWVCGDLVPLLGGVNSEKCGTPLLFL